uniref:hypothetical protein n=1 Tax=uncultured Micrococcus sp. TaxID=114051 RepID=UPI002615B9B6|nr:hypothetical protein [uncultured Micrococcus sp.]
MADRIVSDLNVAADPITRKRLSQLATAAQGFPLYGLTLDPDTEAIVGYTAKAREAEQSIRAAVTALDQRILEAAVKGDATTLTKVTAEREDKARAHAMLIGPQAGHARAEAVVDALHTFAEANREKIATAFDDAGARFLEAFREGFRGAPISLATVLESEAHAEHWRTLIASAAVLDVTAVALDLLDDVPEGERPNVRYARNLAFNVEDREGMVNDVPWAWALDPAFQTARPWLVLALRTPRPGKIVELRYDPEAARADREAFETILNAYQAHGAHGHSAAQYAPAWWTAQLDS